MEGVPGLGSGPLDITVRTIVIYAFVVVGLRLGGKREVGQLGTLDLVALLLLANAVQNAMVGTDSSIGGGVLAGTVILVATRLLDMATRRSGVVRRWLIGESRILIRNGRVNRRAMEREQISEDELQESLHEHGLEYRREVKLATLETDGSISIIPQPEAEDRYQAGGGPDTASRHAGRLPRRSALHPRGLLEPMWPVSEGPIAGASRVPTPELPAAPAPAAEAGQESEALESDAEEFTP